MPILLLKENQLRRRRKAIIMRLPYVEPQDPVTEVIRKRRGGELLDLDRTLLHSIPLAQGWNSMMGTIRTGLVLSADIRELAILRIAILNEASYEWDQHVEEGRAAGLTEPQLESIRSFQSETSPLSEKQKAALVYTDAMTTSIRVPDSIFSHLRSHFDDRHIVELTATIASYNMVSRFLVALDVGERDASVKTTA
ncbi:carboxymuconolactone decarboxylase [Planoprotostelium fungivorum]|uniref:Carboxymuconolactone decarboxylase n=1 Tax=Planoprotostelium fungivorum TaxID=1890364 RepID=A0A2P6NY30_9EUKA|nr:carboxymuconolactone decarboxylase [Planoprotostelium fungivorum]